MLKKLQKYPIPYGTQPWYDFRLRGIGGSEMAAILRQHDRMSPVRIFHEKVGDYPQFQEDKEVMFHGRVHEDYIAQIWQYWDGDAESMMVNYENRNYVRKCRKIDAYVVNPDYPWLFASVDRLINIKSGFMFPEKKPLDKEGVLELKQISGWERKRWEGGVPIYYYIQTHHYMIVLELDYAEICMLVDGNQLVVEPIERNNDLCDRIIAISRKFWYDNVLPARKAYENMQSSDRQEYWSQIINEKEPPPDDTEDYKAFMSDRMKKDTTPMKGNDELFDLCKQDKMLLEITKKLEKKRLARSNRLVKVMVDNESDVIDFGNNGKYMFYQKKNAKNRTPGNYIKELPDEERVNLEVDKIDLEY